jgi:hypothetical protein
MRRSTVLLLGLSSAISLGLADVCQAETFSGRYIIVSETSDIGGSISGYIDFEDAIISNKLMNTIVELKKYPLPIHSPAWAP